MTDMEVLNVVDQDGNKDKVRRVRSRIQAVGLDSAEVVPGTYTNILVSTGETLNRNSDGSFVTLDKSRTFRVV